MVEFRNIAISIIVVSFLVFITAVLLIVNTEDPEREFDFEMIYNEKVGRNCGCVAQTAKEYFCSSDFIFFIDIFNDGRPSLSLDGHTTYPYSLRESLKTPAINLIWTKFQLFTNSSSGCGIKFRKNNDYLVAGKLIDFKLHISACDFVAEWEKLPATIKKDLMGLLKPKLNCD